MLTRRGALTSLAAFAAGSGLAKTGIASTRPVSTLVRPADPPKHRPVLS